MSTDPGTRDDEHLLEAFARRRDREALDALFRRHVDAAFRLAKRVTGNAADAEDAVQAAFVQVMRRSGTFRGRSSARAWLLAIVVNESRQRARSEDRRRAHEDAASAAFVEPSREEVASEEVRALVRDAVDALPEHERLAVSLRYIEDLPFKEVAAVLSVPLGTVHAQVHRGLERLRQTLARGGCALGLGAVIGCLHQAPLEGAPAGLATAVSGTAATAAVGVGIGAGAIAGAAVAALAVVALVAVALREPAPAAAVAAPSGRSWHVAIDGRGDGDGSAARPLDLATAVSASSPARPGDTVWLAAGDYRGPFIAELRGEPDRPITVRARPGERVVLDGAGGSRGYVLTIRGAWTWWQGFEVTDSDRSSGRVSASEGAGAEDVRRASGVALGNDPGEGVGSRVIGLVVHDVLTGIAAWRHALGCELSGNLVFNCGWRTPGGGHGPAITIQNGEGVKRIVGNTWFGGYGAGLLAYGERAPVEGLVIEDNVGWSCPQTPALIGGMLPSRRIVVRRNLFLEPFGAWNPLRLGFAQGAPGEDAVVEDNVLVGGVEVLPSWRSLVFTGNTLMAVDHAWARLGRPPADGWTWDRNVYLGADDPGRFAVEGEAQDLGAWRGRTGFDAASTVADRPGAPLRVVVTPDPYERGRARIVVLAWDRRASVAVDLAAVLTPGARFAIRHVEDWFGTPVVAGRFDGRPVELTLAPRAAAMPLGEDAGTAPRITDPRFHVFIVHATDPPGDPP
ncbi:MAG TPA: sigma-70 family RNA polymerase sigma factor [Planctomycetota bacterium]|nr:sigma-70 family RNA polymerase sigma factor [Planctomycetota bacterium]